VALVGHNGIVAYVLRLPPPDPSCPCWSRRYASRQPRITRSRADASGPRLSSRAGTGSGRNAT